MTLMIRAGLRGVLLLAFGSLPAQVEVRIGSDRRAELENVSVECELEGRFLTRRIELGFRNEGQRRAEGELICPLDPGERVVSYAMEVHGVRREGVIVPRERGRAAYEEIVRKMVDPGILEVDEEKGEFRTRVFPLESGKTKRVWITTLTVLETSEVTVWRKGFGRPEEWSLAVNAVGATRAPASEELELKSREAGSWHAVQRGKNSEMPECRITWAADEAFTAHAPDPNGGAWVCRFVPPGDAAAWKENSLIEFWCDGSQAYGEGALKTVEAFLSSMESATVRLRVFREALEEAEEFEVRDGACAALVERLAKVERRGMARPGMLPWEEAKAEAIVLLSDGVFPEGPEAVGTPPCPLHVIDAGSGSSAWLRGRAVLSGGGWHAAGKLDPYVGSKNASEALTRIGGPALAGFHGGSLVLAGHVRGGIPAGLPSIESPAARWLWAVIKSAEMLQTGRSLRDVEGFNHAHGVMDGSTAWLVLETASDYAKYGFEPPRVEKELYREWEELKDEENVGERRQLDRLAKRWQDRCDLLSREQAPVQDRLLGAMAERLVFWVKESRRQDTFSVKEVRPMMKLLGEMEELSSGEIDAESGNRLLEAFSKFDEFESEMRVRLKLIDVTVGGKVRRPGSMVITMLPTLYEAVMQAGGPTEFGAVNRVKLYRNGKVFTYDLHREDHKNIQLYPGDVVDVPQKNWLGNGGGLKGQPAPFAEAEARPTITVKVAEWDPTRPYVKVLDAVMKAGGDWKLVLRAQREGYGWRADFFLDCIELLERRGMIGEAVSLAGELAELDPANPELLRKAARAFRRLGKEELARSIFRRVLALSPDDEVALFDLAKSIATAGEHAEAARILWKAIQRGDDRYRMGRPIVYLEELNALLSREGLSGEQLGIDPRFLRHVPLELRIVLEWDAQQSNVDLIVRDSFGDYLRREQIPNEQEFFFLSGNVSRGFGPEALSFSKPLPGFYEITARFYGDWKEPEKSSVTAEVEVTRHFGTADEVRERMAVRISEQEGKEVARVRVVPAGWE